MNEVVKPISIVHAEFISKLSNLINTSMLPMFIVESILKEAYNEMHILSKRQLEADMKSYQEAMQAKQKETNDIQEDL